MKLKNEERQALIETAYKAGRAVMDVYRRPIEVETKDDESPLTAADRISNDIILSNLNDLFPDIHIISEETRETPYEIRKDWERCWLVDPLDGTKEFIKKNGEFTINIALIENGVPIFGIVYLPDKEVLYYGSEDEGAYKITGINGESTQIHIQQPTKQLLKVAGSRSHQSEDMQDYIKKQKSHFEEVELMPAGSALKFCLVAEGSVHAYPRLGPTMEWDTGAGQAVVLAAGGTVVRADNHEPLKYNKENLLNPFFIVAADLDALVN